MLNRNILLLNLLAQHISGYESEKKMKRSQNTWAETFQLPHSVFMLNTSHRIINNIVYRLYAIISISPTYCHCYNQINKQTNTVKIKFKKKKIG